MIVMEGWWAAPIIDVATLNGHVCKFTGFGEIECPNCYNTLALMRPTGHGPNTVDVKLYTLYPCGTMYKSFDYNILYPFTKQLTKDRMSKDVHYGDYFYWDI